MNNLTPLSALAGGMLIGLAASLLWLTHGKTAGVSGLFAGLLRADEGSRLVPLAFVAGLLVAGMAARQLLPGAFAGSVSMSWPVTVAAGLLVGFGTRLGGGCTSGHGVCGTSRFAPRSMAATSTFLLTGMATVFVVRHLLGPAS
jgi:uncharacterized protein